MATKPTYLIQGDNIIIVMDGKSHSISKTTHIGYTKIVDAIKESRWGDLRELVEPKAVLTNYCKGNLSITGDTLLWKGEPLHGALAKRILAMYAEGAPIEPMVNFVSRLMNNPSARSIDQTYGFLDKNSLPITEDGYFLAYKKVRVNAAGDFYDIHSGTVRNNVGDTPSMERNKVDDNPDQTCSCGLHFCSISYLNSFGNARDPIVIVKIDPADVVSIPTDYNGAKGRCWKYDVVGIVKGDPKDAFTTMVNKEFSPKVEKVEPIKPATTKWPFPGQQPSAPAKKTPAPRKVKLYDVQRRNGGALEATALTLDKARDLVAKNVKHKKAKLVVVHSGTNIEI